MTAERIRLWGLSDASLCDERRAQFALAEAAKWYKVALTDALALSTMRHDEIKQMSRRFDDFLHDYAPDNAQWEEAIVAARDGDNV